MTIQIHNVDVLIGLAKVPDASVHCVVTSPPYFGLRDYGHEGQIGLEATPQEYVASLVAVFSEVKRVLRDDGTVWLNLGDSYVGGGRGGNPGHSKHIKQATNSGSLTVRGIRRNGFDLQSKQLLGIPWRVAFALQDDGWYLRQDIIWAKPNPMPESVTDRCTKSHEYLFLLSKSARYHFDAKAIAEPATVGFNGSSFTSEYDIATKVGLGLGERVEAETRNRRSVWTLTTQPYSEAHFATFPPALPELCIKAGCPEGGTVLDCFAGAGTTGLVADRLGRDAILFEINSEYAEMARKRIHGDAPMFAQVVVA